MIDERVYHQYANWKLENDELIKYLRDDRSSLIVRFKHVFEVTDYLYDQLIDDPNYNEEQHQIFVTGFQYIFDIIDKIQEILKDAYQNDVKALEKFNKEVNLLLSTIDFQNELLSIENYNVDDMNALLEFEQDVLENLNQKKAIPSEMYEKLDRMTLKIFKNTDTDFYPIHDIFLEIADELGIL